MDVLACMPAYVDGLLKSVCKRRLIACITHSRDSCCKTLHNSTKLDFVIDAAVARESAAHTA
jgi:hypothetical protein